MTAFLIALAVLLVVIVAAIVGLLTIYGKSAEAVDRQRDNDAVDRAGLGSI